MPVKIRTKCRYPRCFQATPCPIHGSTDNHRPSASQRGYDWNWHKYAEIYKRNNPLCHPCEQAGAVTPVYAVDHVVPVSGPDDPRFWDEANHQPICQAHHAQKSNQEMRAGVGRNAPPRAQVTVIVGPPASGKTTHVQEHMQRGDLVFDWDAVCAALSGLPIHDRPEGLLPFVAAARDAIYDRLARPSAIRMAFLITTDMKAALALVQRFGAKLVEMNVSEEDRKMRLEERDKQLLKNQCGGGTSISFA